MVLLSLNHLVVQKLCPLTNSLQMAVSSLVRHALTSKLFLTKPEIKVNLERRTQFPKAPSILLCTRPARKLQAFRRHCCSSSDGFSVDAGEEEEMAESMGIERPMKLCVWVVLWASLSLAWFAMSKDAKAASDAIKASGLGRRIADGLRGSGWADEAVVFALATLPLLELRGAIPVGYWMGLHPLPLTLFAILGNMVPVPIIILYLKRFASFVAGKSKRGSRLVEVVLENAKAKAAAVEEFQWVGLMLFVAVPFPGTGAWTGAIIACVLDMPFWFALTANFLGVVLAALLVNLLVNLGLYYAIFVALLIFFLSTFMWTLLRNIKTSFGSKNQT